MPNHVFKLFTLEALGRTADFEAAQADLEETDPDFEESASYRFYFDELADGRRPGRPEV